MNEQVKEIEKEIIETLKYCFKFCYLSRAKEFQIEACQRLSSLKIKVSELKENIIAIKDEDSANALLSFEEQIDALKNELMMWIALKNDDPNLAWDYLIYAQYAIRRALQSHSVANWMNEYTAHLQNLERLLFPPQIFTSSGIVFEKGECSICGQEYGTCGHVKCKVYMGKLCTRIIRNIKQFNEVSIVSDPADKRCRIYQFSDSDQNIFRDVMTWRIVDNIKPQS